MTTTTASAEPSLSTGIDGLDDVLGGGWAPRHVYLIEGSPGTGKTTLALQFLRAGAAAGERTLYITLSETAEELHQTAASHGWTLKDVELYELVPPESLLDEQQQQSLLYSSDLELGETTQRILAAFDATKPHRLVLDSLSELRLLAQGSLRYRRQILALKHYFAKHSTTVLMLDDMTAEASDRTVQSVAHGVLVLEELAPDYGAERRRLRVAKYRGRRYRGGFHDFAMRTGGIEVFPRLVSSEHVTTFERTQLPSKIEGLNALLGGGVDRGSSVLLLGPAGTGKSLMTLTFVASAIERGERAAMFAFDEEQSLLFDRAKALGFDLQAMIDAGNLFFHTVDAAEISPGEFAGWVRDIVDRNDVRTIVIDSLNGYQAAMPQEHSLILHIHELLQYLNRQGATTFLTVAQHGLVGDMKSPVDITYLADTVILLRYFEAHGRMRRAVSVVKKRTGWHEDTIREFRIEAPDGFRLGEPLTQFQGILRGVPVYSEGKPEAGLLDSQS
jgi:circadian clock protein KaiC